MIPTGELDKFFNSEAEEADFLVGGVFAAVEKGQKKLEGFVLENFEGVGRLFEGV